MSWPSKSVPHGGILHPARSSYSPETHQFLKVLMDESKLTMFQRRKIDYSLRNGEPLPPPSDFHKPKRKSSSLLLGASPPTTIRPGQSKRRSRDTIIDSGAYQRDRFIRVEPIVNREAEKLRLQNRMAFGKDNVKEVRRNAGDAKDKPKKEELPPEMERFKQLLGEIKDREQWLEDMERLGQGKQHRLVIQQQIQARVNEIEGLDLKL